MAKNASAIILWLFTAAVPAVFAVLPPQRVAPVATVIAPAPTWYLSWTPGYVISDPVNALGYPNPIPDPPMLAYEIIWVSSNSLPPVQFIVDTNAFPLPRYSLTSASFIPMPSAWSIYGYVTNASRIQVPPPVGFAVFYTVEDVWTNL